jgi:hypothetical protein
MGRVVALDPDHRLRVECRAVKNCLIEGPTLGGDLRGALDKPGFLAPQFAMLEGESGVSHDLVIQMPRGEANRDRGESRGSSPPTPPYVRVAYTAVRQIKHA